MQIDKKQNWSVLNGVSIQKLSKKIKYLLEISQMKHLKFSTAVALLVSTTFLLMGCVSSNGVSVPISGIPTNL
jgi:hypothetical protein